MTKIDILREEYEKKFAAPSYEKSINRDMNFDYISPAMDRWAESKAIAFGEYINSNYLYQDGENFWLRSEDKDWKPITSVELYQLFLSQDSKPLK